MKRAFLILTACLTLAACGVDGPPERPEPGVRLSGEAVVGVITEL